MPLNEVMELIKQKLQSGAAPNLVHKDLLQKGYNPEEIQDAFFLIKTGKIRPPEVSFPLPVPPDQNNQTIDTSNNIPIPPPPPPPDNLPLPPPPPIPQPAKESIIFKTSTDTEYSKEDENEEKTVPFFSFRFYRNILLGKRKIKVFLILLFFSLFYSIKPIYSLITAGNLFANFFSQSAKNFIDIIYPEKLEIKIQNGIVSTNVTEPYFVTIPSNLFNLSFPPSKINTPQSKIRVMVIDTKGRAENFEKYQVPVLLTSTSLVYYNNDKINIQPLKEIKDFTINKELIDTKYNEINKNNAIGKFFKILLFAVPLFWLLYSLILIYTEVLFFGFLVWLITKIKQIKLKFRNIISFSAALMLVPKIIFGLLTLIPKLNSFVDFGIFLNLIFLSLSYTIIELNLNSLRSYEKTN